MRPILVLSLAIMSAGAIPTQGHCEANTSFNKRVCSQLKSRESALEGVITSANSKIKTLDTLLNAMERSDDKVKQSYLRQIETARASLQKNNEKFAYSIGQVWNADLSSKVYAAGDMVSDAVIDELVTPHFIASKGERPIGDAARARYDSDKALYLSKARRDILSLREQSNQIKIVEAKVTLCGDMGQYCTESDARKAIRLNTKRATEETKRQRARAELATVIKRSSQIFCSRFR